MFAYDTTSGNRAEQERLERTAAEAIRRAVDAVQGENDELDELQVPQVGAFPVYISQRPLPGRRPPTAATSRDRATNTAARAAQYDERWEDLIPDDLPDLLPGVEERFVPMSLTPPRANLGEVLHVEDVDHPERRVTSLARRAFGDDSIHAMPGGGDPLPPIRRS